MFVVGNETPFRQKEEVGLVGLLCFLLISKIQHFSTDTRRGRSRETIRTESILLRSDYDTPSQQ